MSKKGKKGKKGEDNDESTTQIMRFYNRKIQSLGVAQNKIFVQAVAQAIENQEHLTTLHIIEEIGPNAIRGIFEALMDLNYKHLANIWLVKAGLGLNNNEGVKYLANYIQKAQNTKVLDLTENEITPQGCIHLGYALSPAFKVPLQELILDFNYIGCEGMKELSKGLEMNTTIRKLSLNYCRLDLESVKYIQDILSFVDCDLRYLFLEGNYLRNQGVYQLFRALETNEWLEELNIANNQFGESEDVPLIEKICEVLTKNNSIQVYDFRGNALYDDSAKKFLECIKMYKTVCRLEVPIEIQNAILEEIKKVTKKRKRRKNKKKKSKKKKKAKK
ncbi:unnamed protein product [Paramecium octaurelia]|uniref:Uncharacterized protein n=1 Tax=Paramecium octaurelia TaxID=43137 RepID=A0A8S1T2J7_PAROT|nr:unnamed protein product [Paramecium octaurelia]